VRERGGGGAIAVERLVGARDLAHQARRCGDDGGLASGLDDRSGERRVGGGDLGERTGALDREREGDEARRGRGEARRRCARVRGRRSREVAEHARGPLGLAGGASNQSGRSEVARALRVVDGTPLPRRAETRPPASRQSMTRWIVGAVTPWSRASWRTGGPAGWTFAAQDLERERRSIPAARVITVVCYSVV
jgi:hypothetical protein